MTHAPDHILAMMQATPVEAADNAAPEWVHLLPAGQVQTGDRRGPYTQIAAQQMIAASLSEGDRLPIDENHSTDIAAPKGQPAPARGWIVELQSREDGIWGRVEWTPVGEQLVCGRAYRGLSPAVLHTPGKQIVRILRASLVNYPNLRGLVALHQEESMTLLQRLAELLGLDPAATEEDILKAVTDMKAEPVPALQSQMAEIGAALGAGTDPATILAAAKTASGKTAADNEVITALQSQVGELTTSLNALQETGAKSAATAFVDDQIKLGRAGVKPLRDHYIAMHMQDPARVEKELTALPLVGAGQILPGTPPAEGGEIALNSEQMAVADQLGLSHEDFAAELKSQQPEAL